MSLTEERVREALRGVRYPGYTRDIVSFGMVRDIAIDGDRVRIGLHVATPSAEKRDEVFDLANRACLAIGASAVEVVDLAGPGAGKLPLAATGAPARPVIEGVRWIVAVASGKGGVGKSTIAVNLAEALSQQGQRVGLLDADVYGPSVPTMLGLTREQVQDDAGRFVPVRAGALAVMSLGFMLDDDRPAIWRGPMVIQALTRFLHHVAWGELDFLIVDLPPGTGDAQLTLVQHVTLAGAIIVTTPQEVALADVRRAVRMFRQVNVPLLGIIENMSGYRCTACGHDEPLFDQGGGARAAERYGMPYLGAIPIDSRLRIASDEGEPFVRRHPDAPASGQLRAIAARLIETLGEH